ncbi:MAG: polysaccharide biosynthesis/export family protein [Vicinamibacterales bacterium]
MAGPTSRCIVFILIVASLAGAAACGSTGGAIPVELYKSLPDQSAGEYLINVGDTLSIQVWDQPQMSGRMRVRNDGRVSLPFVNDAVAAGKSPSKLAADLESGLKSVVLNPKVTVVVEESKPLTISILGEVSKPGPQPLERDTGVAQALAAAGGLTTFAHKDRIFVVRTVPEPARIHFTYEGLTRKVGAASAFKLRPGDVIIVE